MVRKLPRSILGGHPSGIFESHIPRSILIMDSGADYQGETSLTYLTTLAERAQSRKGMGDVPAHYFIDKDGKIYIGRDIMTPAEFYEGDAFTLRPSESTSQQAAMARLARLSHPRLDLKGYIVIMLLGDFDKELVNEAQEKSMFQLVSNLIFDQNMGRDNIYGLQARYPDTKNPGFYLNNYLQTSILEKNVPAPPGKHRFLIPPQSGLE